MTLRKYMLRAWLRAKRALSHLLRTPASPADELPLRAQLFGAERMEHHGRYLARTQRIGEVSPGVSLLDRLADNQDVLDQACSLLSAAAQDNRRLTPADEWLLDNIYLIEEQVAIARRHLPKGYSLELPRLAEGPSLGLPRVYDIALNAISHGDGRVDAESLSRFIAAYQDVVPLKLGELWAIPIMLRLALIENLRRIAARLITKREDRNIAGQWADQLAAIAETEPKGLVLVIADMARSRLPMTSAFVAEFARRLQGRSAALALPLTWIEQWLADSDQSIEQLVQDESQQQAGEQVSVSNNIGSLRFLSMMDWREFVESMSVLERSLREDPPDTYARMDFATRDHYRHVAEHIAREGKVDEPTVARVALQLAQARAQSAGTEDIGAHVGYYLIDAGRDALERELKLRYGLTRIARRTARRLPLLAYILPIAAVVTFFTRGLISAVPPGAVRYDVNGHMVAWLIGVMAVIAFSELGVALVNWMATLLATPRALPRLDFAKGIPPSARTLVVVPTMLGSLDGVEPLVEALEVRFLANRDDNLRFALLTDFFDADREQMPQDAALLAAARSEIEALNARHPGEHGDLFFLFHRPRRWNARERKWMGEERKRGKLAALNTFLRKSDLREAAGTQFMEIVGDTGSLHGVRYVITLDTDTQLPRDAARELVGTLAHPLNRAVLDPARRVVLRGYGILQPRVGISMSGQQRTSYAYLYGSEPGIDPYTRAVSDVYQDLFLEGSFVGKGIYDIDAFDGALAGRMPDNRILSHDLLEGCYARAGLVSDVQLYEDYPASYAVDVQRRHRWIRGDWQLLPWLMPWAPLHGGGVERNPLSMLSRGKLVDNMRRSLVPAAMSGLLVLGWLLSTSVGDALVWTLWVLAIGFVPPLLASMLDIANRPPDMPLRAHVRQTLQATTRSFSSAALALACLPFEAWFSLDAIARTLWRMLRRRHLLQWNPSSEVERTARDSLGASLRLMWTAPVFALGAALAVARLHPDALVIAAPVLALWLASPALMWWLGRARGTGAIELAPAQRSFLGRLARRTWGYFETHVTADDHWLPPDNVQEHPTLTVARRTSPTNIGMALLADLAAYDFGYLPVGGLMQRIAATLSTLDRLPRHRGHFYNWYDTETLLPLPPHYVSTVDSGNLAGHLLTLRQGLLALVYAPLLSPAAFGGLADTLGVLRETRGRAGDSPAMTAFAALLATPSTQPAATPLARLHALLEPAGRIASECADAGGDAQHWSAALLRQCHALHDDLAAQAPWLAYGDAQREAILPAADVSLAQLAQAHVDPDPDADPQHSAAAAKARARIVELERLAHVAGQFAQIDYGFLYDPARHLLAIGYNVDEHRRDPGFYDLLASEARLCSFVAIAQSKLPQETWFALGRLLTEVDGAATLLSWSGSMFEYLMPQLVMPTYTGTLLDQTARNSVRRQIDYGRQREVPWGISESGYNLVDARMNYQYRAFGIPGMGLKRGLAQDLVIAPYASMMALMVEPDAACANLQRLTEAGFSGRLGMYEAIDYTPARVPRGQAYALVRSYMAHHQGMGLLALDYLLHNQPMQKRFVADAEFQSTLLLLQERIPRTGVFHPHAAEVASAGPATQADETQLRVFRSADLARPAVQILSNGRYHVMLSNAGGGYSRAQSMAVTRWREDGTRDHWGAFCYLRDTDSGDVWSAAHQPTGVVVDDYEAIFSDAKAEFRGARNGIETHLEVAVSPEDDIELRRLHLVNRSRQVRSIEITTYAEVVLAPAAADEAHPAFSNLFVQTELAPAKQAILCTRRARSQHEQPPWMFHLLAMHGADIEAISYETDRARFVGRGRSLRNPLAMNTATLSGAQGSVLDPVASIRARIRLAPGQSATVDMVTGVGDRREACATLIDRYRDRRLADRVFDLAWTHSQVVRRQINASQADAQLYERMAGLVLYAHPALRADASVLLHNRRGQSGLWGQAISGDNPLVLLQIASIDNIELVRQLVQAHAYWRLKGLVVDLVIWNEDQAGYRQQLQDQIMGLIAGDAEGHMVDRPGGIFVRPAHQISQEDRVLIQSVARVIVSDSRGTLIEQLNRRAPPTAVIPLLVPAPMQDDLLAALHVAHADAPNADVPDASVPPASVLHAHDPWPFDAADPQRILGNDLGGFSRDGREYVIDLQPGATTPAPWSNVIANARFGCVLSESSLGYSWGENAHEYRLTPWHNDPVTDTVGEAIYLRDEDSGQVWSPTALPCRGEGTYRVRHGFGYSVHEHEQDGISSELWIFVDLHEAVKYSVLKLRNSSGRPRRLSVTGYVEWVLGDLRDKTQMHVVTEIDADSGVLVARNAYNTAFEGRVAFFDTDAVGAARSVTADRSEFLGRNGDMARPAALLRERLSGRVGAGLDPCAAIQTMVELHVGQEHETVFRLGAGRNWGTALALAKRVRGVGVAHDALDAVRIHWMRTLGTIQVDTPEPSVDVLANGWLLYQTIACRYLARSGYYQSGGAFGFRDQLQDVMAMVHAQPHCTREHLLRSAAQQFPEGDVLHWWHPPQGRGVRTRCSDDYLWLPLAATRYVDVTGDAAVLDEQVYYIEGRPVNVDEESYYDLPTRSHLRQSLYAHCQRSLERGLRLLGERGLPLMETGDWNDGMNLVGDKGKGESVWLGFFLYDVLQRFGALANARGDQAFAATCSAGADKLRGNLEQHAWDGAWYRRAWFDNGAPLGSTASDECRIDSIAQSWSVLSGAGDPQRARTAMDSLDQHLVNRDAGLVQLLDPPFDKTPQDPGYIRGYVPGVRENGGQYTHAAIWATMAFAKLGDSARAWELLRMINPVHHGTGNDAIATYKVEPYVVAADVYAVPPHVGRGGWTWYTGSAGWMYRLIVESLLGVHREGEVLHLLPCIPAEWPRYGLRYRHANTLYEIEVARAAQGTPATLTLDGVEQPQFGFPLVDDGNVHVVEAWLAGAAQADAGSN